MPLTGYVRINGLADGNPDAAAISVGDGDADAVRLFQELIRCHSYRMVPGRKHYATPPVTGGETFGTFGTFTKRAVLHFKKKYNKEFTPPLPEPTSATVDRATLRALLDWTDNQTTPGAGAGLPAARPRPVVYGLGKDGVPGVHV